MPQQPGPPDYESDPIVLYGKLSPKARRFVLEVASHRSESNFAAWKAIGGNARRMLPYYTWQKKFPNLRQVLDDLRANPVAAADFLAAVNAPRLMAYWQDVFDGKEPGDKAAAARQLARRAERRQVKELEDTAVAPEPSRLKALMEEKGA